MEFESSDFTSWIGIAYTIIAGVIGWFIKQARDRAADQKAYDEKLEARFKETEKMCSDLRLQLLTEYHNSDELEKAISTAIAPLSASLARIERFIELAFPVNGHGHHAPVPR